MEVPQLAELQADVVAVPPVPAPIPEPIPLLIPPPQPANNSTPHVTTPASARIVFDPSMVLISERGFPVRQR
jgi:hypothetical protein